MNNENKIDIGGPKSAFTRYVKYEESADQVIINTRTRRRSAFTLIKQLFSIHKNVEPAVSSKYEDK
jgi:hypothetical protein